ncbi:MAG: phosphoribosylformylglycinamidine cyclo-ligase [Candidatus Hydrogenedentota bacterium]|nr:MAG: phosphoribosylformylglycinamidine cyclo-ligase [Candidatus Hydrogenedentota bacterium]
MPLTYEQTGVDTKRGDEVVQRLRRFLPEIGDFNGRFPLPEFSGVRPSLVAAADGVGTKVLLVKDREDRLAIGTDLVAMNINDILCSGAKPLFFLDYIATGRLDPEKVEELVRGIGQACDEAGCILLGGETAEMPDLYGEEEFDLAGFAVGIVDEEKAWGRHRVRSGDLLVGLASSGIHSNGLTLARKALRRFLEGPDKDETVRKRLLVPTRIYARAVEALPDEAVHAAAHITGGGLVGNLVRVLPEGAGFRIDKRTWIVPEVFELIRREGRVENDEMFSVFNMGIGMVLVSERESGDEIRRILEERGYASSIIGEVTETGTVEWKDSDGGTHR